MLGLLESVVVDLLIFGVGRRLTVLILPESMKESTLVHFIVGFTFWIAALILVILIARSIPA